MTRPRLHLDADASIKALYKALRERGHDVTRTPTEWMPLDANDRAQLLGATAQGRILFTFNIHDFLSLANQYPEHHGLLLATQDRWTLRELIYALDRMLSETEADEWVGQVRWLNDWKE
ncbi:MAG: DUF5615 family PIN-like protein [Anaerolineales bacterium]|nr:DUF5615 family PIN-like protein [Anaerolineales bacterium]